MALPGSTFAERGLSIGRATVLLALEIRERFARSRETCVEAGSGDRSRIDTLIRRARTLPCVSTAAIPDRVSDRLEVSQRSLLALAPWTFVGASAYVLFQTGVLSLPYGDVLQVPAAYLGTAILAGVTWVGAALAAERSGVSTEGLLAGVGGVAAALAVAAVLSTASGDLRIAWPLAGVGISAAASVAVWVALGWVRPAVTDRADGLGLLAVFGQVLDGVLTAIGVDVFGFGERTPLSRVVLRFAGDLPTADLLGTGWLLLLVKAGLAVGVLWLLADTVEEDPTVGLLMLAAVAAVGLGPGLHNTLLFVVASPGG